jgi:hypothetical protein
MRQKRGRKPLLPRATHLSLCGRSSTAFALRRRFAINPHHNSADSLSGISYEWQAGGPTHEFTNRKRCLKEKI